MRSLTRKFRKSVIIRRIFTFNVLLLLSSDFRNLGTRLNFYGIWTSDLCVSMYKICKQNKSLKNLLYKYYSISVMCSHSTTCVDEFENL